MTHDYDIIIVGAGLVGTSLVVALQSQGLRIAVLEKNLPETLTDTQQDQRPISLAYASQVALAACDVWPHLASSATPIKAVHVSEKGRLGNMRFTAEAMSVPALGYVVPFATLQNTLYTQAANTGATFMPIQGISAIRSAESGTEIVFTTSSGEKTLRCALLVGADGTQSRTRTLLQLPTDTTPSDEIALTAYVTFDRPHNFTAFERFTNEGTLAMLPLRDPHAARLVWSLSTAHFQTVQSWDASTFRAQVETLFSGRLGHIKQCEQDKHFPLATVIAKEQVRPGFVLIGNAAHTLYPIAAQGFNLGLRDVAVLAEILIAQYRAHRPLGALSALEAYRVWRHRDQSRTIGLTRSVSHLFGLQFPMLGFFRSMGLLTLDLVSPLKRDVAKQAMGLYGKLPKLLRGIPLHRDPFGGMHDGA